MKCVPFTSLVVVNRKLRGLQRLLRHLAIYPVWILEPGRDHQYSHAFSASFQQALTGICPHLAIGCTSENAVIRGYCSLKDNPHTH